MSSLQVVACFSAPHLLGELMVLFALVVNNLPPVSEATLEGHLLLTTRSHAHGLHSLLVPSCFLCWLNDSTFYVACLVGSGWCSLSLTGFLFLPECVVLPAIGCTSLLFDSVHAFPSNLAQVMDGLVTALVLASHRHWFWSGARDLGGPVVCV
jgi:hypothetical protein